jgi:hypothetical protein
MDKVQKHNSFNAYLSVLNTMENIFPSLLRSLPDSIIFSLLTFNRLVSVCVLQHAHPDGPSIPIMSPCTHDVLNFFHIM